MTMTHVVTQPPTPMPTPTSPSAHTDESSTMSDPPVSLTETVIWDRKTEGGFPETKELKNRVRNIIEPGRDLGHIDRSLKKSKEDKIKEEGDEKQEGLSEVVQSDSPGSGGQQDIAHSGSGKATTECEDCK